MQPCFWVTRRAPRAYIAIYALATRLPVAHWLHWDERYQQRPQLLAFVENALALSEPNCLAPFGRHPTLFFGEPTKSRTFSRRHGEARRSRISSKICPRAAVAGSTAQLRRSVRTGSPTVQRLDDRWRSAPANDQRHRRTYDNAHSGAIAVRTRRMHSKSTAPLLRVGTRLEPRDLLVAVAEIARLGPLLAGGVLSVFDAVPEDDVDWLNHPEYGAAMHDIRAETELLLGATGLSHIEQTSIANVLIERVLWQLRQQATALLAVKPSAAMFFDDPIERALFERISAVGVQATTQSHESLRLHNLIDLRLPGIADIGLGDMVLIRDDDSFGTFRTDMRRALIDSRPSLDDGDVSAARLIVREHMISGADRLKASTARGRIGDLIAKDSLGWLLGAALAASVEGLSGALTMALGKLIVDLTETPRSTSALRARLRCAGKARRFGGDGCAAWRCECRRVSCRRDAAPSYESARAHRRNHYVMERHRRNVGPAGSAGDCRGVFRDVGPRRPATDLLVMPRRRPKRAQPRRSVAV